MVYNGTKQRVELYLALSLFCCDGAGNAETSAEGPDNPHQHLLPICCPADVDSPVVCLFSG